MYRILRLHLPMFVNAISDEPKEILILIFYRQINLIVQYIIIQISVRLT